MDSKASKASKASRAFKVVVLTLSLTNRRIEGRRKRKTARRNNFLFILPPHRIHLFAFSSFWLNEKFSLDTTPCLVIVFKIVFYHWLLLFSLLFDFYLLLANDYLLAGYIFLINYFFDHKCMPSTEESNQAQKFQSNLSGNEVRNRARR